MLTARVEVTLDILKTLGKDRADSNSQGDKIPRTNVGGEQLLEQGLEVFAGMRKRAPLPASCVSNSQD
jgi:hypothetical protein